MRFLLLWVAILVLFACPVWAAKWDVGPAFSINQTYTDNLSLAPDPLRRSDWVTQLVPEISIKADGTGLGFSAKYAPEFTYYARNQGENQVFQVGNAFLVAELADNLLFFDAGADVDQYNVFLQDPQSASNVNTTGNRATATTFFASPYLHHDFGAYAQAEARFTYSAIDSSDAPQFNNTANRIDLDLTNGSAYRLLGWKFAYTKAAIEYENVPDIDAEVILADSRLLLTTTFGLLAQVGDETYERTISGSTFGEEAGGSRWGAGFDYAPSPRTYVAAIVGKRFFGNAYDLVLRHRASRITLSATYDQDVTTARTEFFVPENNRTADYLDPLYCAGSSDADACRQGVESVISKRGLPTDLNQPVNFFSEQPFILKRWQASASLLGARNLIIVNLFTETREILPGAIAQGPDFAESRTIDQTGTGILWNLLITARSSWNLDAAYSRNEFTDTARVDDLTSLRAGFTRQFQPRLSGNVSYRMQQNKSNRSESSFTENVIEATLRMEF